MTEQLTVDTHCTPKMESKIRTVPKHVPCTVICNRIWKEPRHLTTQEWLNGASLGQRVNTQIDVTATQYLS